MIVATLFASENRFSHTPLRAIGTYTEGEYTRNQILAQVEEYKARFAAKRYSALKVLVVDLRPIENEVEVLQNLDLKNELAKKTVINPSKKDRPVREKQAVYQPVGPQETWATIDELAAAATFTQAG